MAEGELQILRPGIFSGTGVTAGFTTRKGGVSRPPFASLNLGYSSGDDREAVTRNRQLLARTLRIEPDDIALGHQVHGSRALLVHSPGQYPGHDGLVTTRPDVCLCIVAADCAAILLADSENSVIAACHAGWRGAAQGIIPNTLQIMTEAGANPASLKAYVSPCISAKHFEVGLEVAEQFDQRHVAPAEQASKRFVDLKSAIRDQLITGGLSDSNVEKSDLCTYERTDLFYSHRAESGRTGRMMGYIMRRS